jgi:hypothetical protein
MNLIGARLASGQKLVDELCSAHDQTRTSKPGELARDSRVVGEEERSRLPCWAIRSVEVIGFAGF